MLVADSFLPVRDHRFTGLPSADIANLSSLRGRAAAPGLLSARWECESRAGNENAVVCVDVEICRRFDSGVELDSRYGTLMAADWQKSQLF